MIQQIELRKEDQTLVCLVNWPRKLKAGMRLTLKEYPDACWTVCVVYSIPVNMTINKTWRVGGL